MNIDDRERYLDRIGELFERASYRQALSVCESALTAHPTCAEVHDFRGLILCRLGRFREALPSYDRAISLEPDFVPALLDKAELLVFYLAEAEPAIGLADRVLRICSHDMDLAHASYIKGVAYAELDQHDEAIVNYDLSLGWDPHYPDCRCEKGVAYYEAYDFRTALQCLKEAVSLDPTHGRPHHFLGCIYEFMGELDLADREFAAAADLDPESYPPPLRLSEADFEKAVQEAIHTLPRAVTKLLKKVELSWRPLPDRLELAKGESRPSSRAQVGGPMGRRPELMVLHQRNLEHASRDRSDLVEEIAHVIAHALGHPELDGQSPA